MDIKHPGSRRNVSGGSGIVGIATDATLETTLPVAHLDDIAAIAAMMPRSAVRVEDVLTHA
jgi:hypothetical protein